MEKLIYVILILNICVSLGKSAPTIQTIFTQIPTDKCPRLGSSILSNASLPYFKPCKNAQLTNLPKEFSLFTIGDFLCFGIFDAEFKLCSIINENYEELPVRFEDLQKQLELIQKKPTEEFCIDFRKVNEKATIEERALEETLKTLYMNIEGNGCNKVCSDFNGKTNKLCLILYLINSFNYDLSTPIKKFYTEQLENGSNHNSAVKNKRISIQHEMNTNPDESKIAVETQQNQIKQNLSGQRERNHEILVNLGEHDEFLEQKMTSENQHKKSGRQNTGYSGHSPVPTTQNIVEANVENIQENVELARNRDLERGDSGAEGKHPGLSEQNILLPVQNREPARQGSTSDGETDTVPPANVETQPRQNAVIEQNPNAVNQDLVPGGQNPASGGKNIAPGGQNPASGNKTHTSGGQNPASGNLNRASGGQNSASGVPNERKPVPSPNSGPPAKNSTLSETLLPQQNTAFQKDNKHPTVSSSTPNMVSTLKTETTETSFGAEKKQENDGQNEQNNKIAIDEGDLGFAEDSKQQEEEVEDNGPAPPKTADYADEDTPGQMNEKETSRGAEELGQSVSMRHYPEDEDSNFFSYFMFISVMFIAGYVIYHNKQKILALVLEGRRDRNSRRRPNTASYRKLNSNLEEAVTSKCSNSASHVIY